MTESVSFLNLTAQQWVFVLPIVLTILGGSFIIAIIYSVQWRRIRIAEMELSLKSQMIEKGMSPAEIEKVLNMPAYSRRH